MAQVASVEGDIWSLGLGRDGQGTARVPGVARGGDARDAARQLLHAVLQPDMYSWALWVVGGRSGAAMTTSVPLYLNLTETKVLAVAVGLQITVDSRIVLDEENAEAITEHYGAAGTARGDQVRAAARQRLPVLRSLRTALTEHGMSLERMQGGEDDLD